MRIGVARLADGIAQRGYKVWPSEANFVLIEFPITPGQTASDANQFLMGRGMIPREVANYGLPNFLRITVGTEEENTQLLDAFTAFAAARAA